MKKLFVALLILTLLLAGCGAREQTSTPTTGKQAAPTEELMDVQALRAIAYEHAGVAEADVYDVDDEWKTLPDKTLYQLDFDAKGVEYEYGLNAQTGVVVYSTYEGGTQEEPTLTTEDAKRIALEHAQLTEEDVFGLHARLDEGVFEVEFNANGFEYDYEIDSISGEIFKAEKDRD